MITGKLPEIPTWQTSIGKFHGDPVPQPKKLVRMSWEEAQPIIEEAKRGAEHIDQLQGAVLSTLILQGVHPADLQQISSRLAASIQENPIRPDPGKEPPQETSIGLMRKSFRLVGRAPPKSTAPHGGKYASRRRTPEGKLKYSYKKEGRANAIQRAIKQLSPALRGGAVHPKVRERLEQKFGVDILSAAARRLALRPTEDGGYTRSRKSGSRAMVKGMPAASTSPYEDGDRRELHNHILEYREGKWHSVGQVQGLEGERIPRGAGSEIQRAAKKSDRQQDKVRRHPKLDPTKLTAAQAAFLLEQLKAKPGKANLDKDKPAAGK